jgi:hypothetical protein
MRDDHPAVEIGRADLEILRKSVQALESGRFKLGKSDGRSCTDTTAAEIVSRKAQIDELTSFLSSYDAQRT